MTSERGVDRCPKCGSKTAVVKTINFPGIRLRTRKCRECKFEFTTRETSVDLKSVQLVIP